MQRDLADKRKAWNKIFESLKGGGTDIQTWSLRDGYKNYFHAITRGTEIIVGCSENVPSCKIDPSRPIFYEDFERVADVYNQYITGEVKRQDMTKKGWNTTYIISLIVRFL